MLLLHALQQINMRHIILHILLIIIGLSSCQLQKLDKKKELICNNKSKTWILDKTTINGVLKNNRRLDAGPIEIVFNTNGDMDMGTPMHSHWKIRENCDSIWFTINTITKTNYADKILKLNKDTFIIQLITDKDDTIVDYLYHLSDDHK